MPISKAGRINKKTERKIEAIWQAYKEEGPLTVRRIYYVLLSQGFFDLTKSRNPKYADLVYKNLDKRLVIWREAGRIPSGVIIDRTREFIKRTSFKDFDECFISALDNYAQDSMLDQERAVEVWIEKDTMRSTFIEDCYLNDVPLVISKGFTSWTCKDEAVRRFKAYRKPVTVLYFGDFDYAGEHIPAILNAFIRERLPNLDLEFKKVLLTKDDFDRLREYAVDFKTNKKERELAYVQDFISRYGEIKLEVEALPFSETRRRLREELAQALDLRIVRHVADEAERVKADWIKKHYRA